MRRLAAPLALALAIVALAVVLTGGEGTHTLHLRFPDAGQLVTGNRVSVATRTVGHITGLDVTPDGQADVTVAIRDSAWPLHLGTTAQIRLTSQVGVANRYIDLQPGDVRSRALRDGEVVGTDYTHGIVDVDQTLDDFTPRVRNDLRAVLRGSEQAIDGAVPSAQQAIDLGAPALSQSAQTLGEITADTTALARLVSAGGRVSSALGHNAGALSDATDRTAALLDALARERRALAGVLQRAPRVLPAATRTLRRVRASIDRSVRPTLRRLLPVARPLAHVLERLPVAATRGVPLLQRLRALLPPTTLAMRRAPEVAKAGVPAVRAATRALAASQDQFDATLRYAPDLIVGGATLYGAVTGYYDANGHYLRFNLVTAEDSPFATIDAALGGATRQGFSSGHVAPCPGGATLPAPDKSNPRPAPKSLCDPADNLQAAPK